MCNLRRKVMDKLYAVTFIKYTNYCKNCVSDEDGNYIDIPEDGPFLIREKDIEKYMKFGGGFESLKFVGFSPEQDTLTTSDIKGVTLRTITLPSVDHPEINAKAKGYTAYDSNNNAIVDIETNRVIVSPTDLVEKLKEE